MLRNRQIHRWVAWLAGCAILLASLLPSLSHALASQTTSRTFWAELCTANGVQSVLVTAHADSPAQDHGSHWQDCHLCSLHADAVDSPARPMLYGLISSSTYRLPTLFYHAPRPLFAWSAPPSHAPPPLA